MRRRRGFTLVELIISSALLILTITAILALMISGLRSFERTTTDVNLSQPNAQACRRITETLREAMSVSIDPALNRLYFTLPARATTVDAVTGEYEFKHPLVSDGITRFFQVNQGVLIEFPGRRELVSGITNRDPDPASSQFGLPYEPFQATTIGAKNAVTINLITRQDVNSKPRYTRMKSTVMVQNIR